MAAAGVAALLRNPSSAQPLRDPRAQRAKRAEVHHLEGELQGVGVSSAAGRVVVGRPSAQVYAAPLTGWNDKIPTCQTNSPAPERERDIGGGGERRGNSQRYSGKIENEIERENIHYGWMGE